MDDEQIQQTNLVSDEAAAAMNDNASPQIIQPGSAEAPAQPADTTLTTDQPVEPPVATKPEESPPDAEPAVTPETPVVEPTENPNELDEIKKSVLGELRSLIELVKQSPEERFKTVMMLIRSNDDPSLVGQAYETAKTITDEKKRADAFLNIVSEIEYLKSKTN